MDEIKIFNNMKIIKNPLIFHPNYTPNELLYRDDIIEKIKQKIKIGVGNLFIIGDTGVGKTVCVKKALEFFDDIEVIYINCSNENSYIQICKKIINTLQNKKNYSEKGKSRTELSIELIKTLKTKRKKRFVIVIDEIDKLINKERDHQDVLIPIIENITSNIILISNQFKALDNLKPMIKSRLQLEAFIIRRYGADEIYEILKNRALLGFNDNSYENQFLAQTSRFYYKTTGDIRDSLGFLLRSANLAEEKGCLLDSNLFEEFLKTTQETEFDLMIDSLTEHQKFVIISILRFPKYEIDDGIEIRKLWRTYTKTAKSHNEEGRDFRAFEYFISKLIELGFIKRDVKSPKNRRGRVSLVYPLFDTEYVLDKYFKTTNANAHTPTPTVFAFDD